MTEEELARDAVDCPRCKAAAGEPCHDSAGNPLPQEEGGPLVHPARVVAYRESIGEPGWTIAASAHGTVTPAEHGPDGDEVGRG